MSKTAVVILNWNTRDFLDRFIPSILRSTEGLDADVVVADSGSDDGSLELLSERYPSVIQVPLGKNFGFTGGYNLAFKKMEAEKKYDYFLLLNSDIEVPEGWLGPLVRHMDSHPDCGACSPKLHSLLERDSFEYAGAAGGLIDSFGYPFCRGRVLSHLEKDRGQYDADPADMMWATGACLMVRTGLWKELGGLDDRFFAHMEEIDLCWRMQLRGWKVTVIPESTVYHLGGGTLPKESPQKLFLNYRNNILLLQNNLAGTFALEFLKKGSSTSKAAEKGLRKASRRILMRKALDGLSAGVYLLTGSIQKTKAVYNAHKESSRIGRKPSAEEVAQVLDRFPEASVEGFGGNVFIEFIRKKI